MTNREKKKQFARILKSMSSSDDRLERAITALEEAAGNSEEQEALEQNPSKCNICLILDSSAFIKLVTPVSYFRNSNEKYYVEYL